MTPWRKQLLMERCSEPNFYRIYSVCLLKTKLQQDTKLNIE